MFSRKEEAAYGELGLLEETSHHPAFVDWLLEIVTGLLVAEGVWIRNSVPGGKFRLCGKDGPVPFDAGKYSYVMTHDRESGLLNYQSYIRCLSHENQEIYSSMG
ncbi:MAG: hypothetical protein ACLVG5_03055 [Clostridium sp.]